MPYTQADLDRSRMMDPVHGTVDIDVPIDVLWACFTHANYWPRWNKCFFWAKNRSLEVGRQLVWCFQPIRWWYPYKMWAIAKIVEVEEKKRVAWEVTALPGFYARHTYSMEDLGNGRSRFGSHEKATGWGFRLMRWFWVTHFRFVKDRSLEGAKALERVYKEKGTLKPEELRPKRYWPFFLSLLVLAALIGVAGFATWFYVSFVRLTSTELAPGVHAVFGGGGNSLVVQDGKEVLLVDTKFPPGSTMLHDWLDKNVRPRVTKVINTHYHYDHTKGNVLYPGARIYAHARAKELMTQRDGDWWADKGSGLPVETFHDGTQALTVGGTEVQVTCSGTGHTEGDVWLYLPKHNIVMTGDLVFHTYYPFFDWEGEGGADIAPMARTVRELADKHPDARFLPGHGPLATAADLRRYADYLETLDAEVKKARAKGLSEDQAVKEIDLSKWDLKILPSFHHPPVPEWATAKNDVRMAYRVQERRKE